MRENQLSRSELLMAMNSSTELATGDESLLHV